MRKEGVIPYLRPDGKSQVTVDYEGGRPVRIDKVLISAQHQPNIPHARPSTRMSARRSIRPILPPELVDAQTKYW